MVIVSVIEGSPAEEAGILPGDITVAVDGVVERLAIDQTQQVEAGDLLLVVRPAH